MSEGEVPATVARLVEALTKPKPMRRGSVSERSMKCGQKECRCQHDPEARNGPYYSLTRAEGGKTRSRYLNAAQAAVARQQIEAGRSFASMWKPTGWPASNGRTPNWMPPRRPRKRRPKRGFKTAFEAEIVHEIEALVGTGNVDDWDLETIETATSRQAMRVAARAVEQRIKADLSDHKATLPCQCGSRARYAGRRGKSFESVLGVLRLERAYYHCAACEKGFCPRDEALGLVGGSLSPAVQRMVGLVGAMVSFEEGHELLQELASVNVPTKHVERDAGSNRSHPQRPRCTWVWTVRACRYAPPNGKAAPASKPTARPRPAR